MKKIILLLLLMMPSLIVCNAQTDSLNMWNITGQYLFEQGEISLQGLKYPIKTDNGTAYSFHIYNGKSKSRIEDPDYMIPETKTFELYLFYSDRPHAYYYLLFVKNGEYKIINMRESIENIMIQGVITSSYLHLTEQESLYMFEQAIQYCRINSQNQEGEPFIINWSKVKGKGSN